jgi:hypothetical protein
MRTRRCAVSKDKTVKTRYCAPVAPQMDAMLRLTREGYQPAARGMVCHNCQQAGFVWVKCVPERRKELYYCGSCEAMRVVAV